MNPTNGVIGEAWGMYKAQWTHLLTISFITYLIVAIATAVLAILLTWLGILLGLVLTIVALFWLQAALIKAVEDIRDGRADLSFGETFEAAKPHLASVIVGGQQVTPVDWWSPQWMQDRVLRKITAAGGVS